ncbi:MAG: ABC transporter ATP-binding protein/permease [Clostridiales bacterium]|jgi:ATP-binding cassette subfamily B protein|nr:ABC transporter ATP-binding protein/permease [Clostridiales bacterium]
MFNLGKAIGKKFGLSEQGGRDLNKAIWACVLTSLVLYVPFLVFIRIVEIVIKPMIDGGEPEWGKAWIWFGVGLAACVVYFFVYGFEYMRTYGASYSESEKARCGVAEKVRKLPMSFFMRRDLSEVTTHMMSDCTNIEQVLSHVLPQLIGALIVMPVVLIALAVFNWAMALAVFCTLPVSIAIVVLSRRYQAKHANRLRAAQLAVSADTQEYIDGIKVIKAFGTRGAKFKKLDDSLKNMSRAQMRMELGVGVLITGATMLLQAGFGITVFVGTALLTGGGGALDFAVFLTFLLISSRIYGPVAGSLALTAELFYFAAATKRMRTLNEEPVMGGETPEIGGYGIEFEGVTFAYNEAEVIKGVTCALPQNAVTALVGPSGSGKSTMAYLIARFYDPQKGAVKIGGVDIRSVDPEHLMSYISFVFQDVVLFNDTVMNNIRIGKNGATDEEVVAAAKAARCDEFIRKLPDGYGAVIGENGCTLSGGERQRISIARALLKAAPIVLLDEATASLDPENETLVQSAIAKLIDGRTVAVIAHRLKTVAGADQILVLDGGGIAERGTHAELMGAGGLYAKMFAAQAESAGWQIGG